MTLTEIIQWWVGDAEQAHGSAPRGVVVTPELFTCLEREQGGTPRISGLAVLTATAEEPAGGALPPLAEMVEIAGPDRVSIYVGVDPAASSFPLGLDPAMPVVFVPVPPNTLDDLGQLETYNQLRWYGLGPDEALAGVHQ